MRQEQPPVLEDLGGALPCLFLVLASEKGYDRLVASGCFLRAGGSLFWLTAGHVIDKIEGFRDAGHVRTAAWVDSRKPAVPAVIRAWERVRWNQGGRDLGIVELHPNQADNLKAVRRFKAFSLSDCTELRDLKDRNLEDACVLGYPEEWTGIETALARPGLVQAEIFVRPVAIPLLGAVSRRDAEEAGPTADDFWDPECFFAQIPAATDTSPDIDELNSVRGVSGGPVVARIDDKYVLLGLQTAWLERHRVIRWFPIGLAKRFLLDYLSWRDERPS